MIDFDASVALDTVDPHGSSNKGYLGSKVSTGYIPPELLYIDASQNTSVVIGSSAGPTVSIKSPIEYDNMLQQDPPLNPVLASPHTDMWPLGAILYYLCTGETLFLNNDNDNTDNKSLLQLYAWTKDFKEEKLLKISDKLARNLVSRLLNKDAKKRPLTSAGKYI